MNHTTTAAPAEPARQTSWLGQLDRGERRTLAASFGEGAERDRRGACPTHFLHE